MLAELMVHAASRRRTPPRFRPHIADAVRYWSRGQRQSRAWAPHLAKTRSLIDTTIDDIARRRTVAVLGSGPLLDIPLESLARTFQRVILIDRIHLPVIDARLARYDNVELCWHDFATSGEAQKLAVLDQYDDLDWIISTGLLAPLAQQAGTAAPAMIAGHLERLRSQSCPVTLVTDLDFRLFNRHGVLLDSGDLMQGCVIPRSGLRWKWEISPFGDEHQHRRRVHSMGAWVDWRETVQL